MSVITPAFNRVRFIEQTIRSVLDQTYSNLEHVIVDGGSRDGTTDILARYHAEYPERVRYISEPDRGGCEAFNKGCKMARGQVFGWLGSDDLYLPDTIAYAVNHFKCHANDSFIYGEADFIDSRGSLIGRFATQDFTVARALNYGACFAFPAAFYRREVVERTGGFRINDEACDHDWVIRAGMHYRLTRLPVTLCRFRLHPGGKSGSIGDDVYPRAGFLINRRYGGKWLSPICRRYYRQLLFRIPFLRFIYEQLFEFSGFEREIVPHCRRIAVFGAALSGFQSMEMLAKSNRIVPMFIDSFPPSSGTYCGLPVVTPRAFAAGMQQEVDAVMIATASRRGKEMHRQLRKLGFHKPIYCFRFSRFSRDI